MRAFWVAILLTGAFGAVTASADELAYELKLSSSKPGDRWRVRTQGSGTVTTTLTVGGRERVSEDPTSSRAEYVVELLERPAGSRRPTKERRTYTVAEETKQGKTTRYAYHNKTVLIEKTPRGYQFTADGRELTEEEAEKLASGFRPEKETEPTNQDFLPDRPVKVGERWTRDPLAVMKGTKEIGPIQIDVRRTTVRGQLLGVYERDGARVGVVEVVAEFPVTGFDPGSQVLEAKPGSRVKMTVKVDLCIDGSTHFEESTVTSDIDVTFVLPNGTDTLRIKGTDVDRELVSPVGLSAK